MGCAPSQSEIIQHLAKNTFKPLKKATGLSSVDRTPAESQPFSINKGLENSDSESNLSEDVQEDTRGPRNKDPHQEGRGRCQNIPTSALPTKRPEVYNKETNGDKLTTSTKMAITEVTSSQVRAPRDTSVQKDYADCDHSSNSYAVQQSKKSKKKARHSAKQTKSAKLRSRSQSRGEDEKVNFPTSLVEAHHAAYAYLNPSLSKYDAILSLTDQATQTQLMLQQMVSFLTLRFEEINQMLEEIAAEGERLVRDIGPHLTWPAEKGDQKEQPDLLQQLLLYTVNKMQATNGTVTSLTAAVLQETCDYLQSAANVFQKRFLAKQQVDERLRILIDQLGSCTMQPAHPKPRDATLYSEDSGIGADTESTKECCTLRDHSNPEKGINGASCDSNVYSLCRKSNSNPPLSDLARTSCCCSNSHHHQCRGAPCSPPEEKASCSRPNGSASSASLRQNRSLGSLESFTSVECEALAHGESMDFCSLGEDEEEEEGSESDSATGSPQRPRSSPPGTTAGRSALKRIEKPENEEMTIKMRDAISHRIQFVPTPTASQAWSDDESTEQPARPRSAGGPRSRRPKKRRSRSAESLRSKAEDPTLLELQRTQEDLSRRLDRMHRAGSGAGAEAGRRRAAGSPARAQPSAKLRASLRRNFSVLPSPERPPGQAEATGSVQLLIGSFNRVGAEPPAPRRPSAPTLPSVPHLPRRKQRANSSPVGGGVAAAAAAAAALPPVTASTETDTEDFPPPPTTLELAAAPSYACAATATDAGWAAGVAGACVAPGTGSPSTTGACAAREAAGGPASASKAAVTQRLMASLDSVALLPSRHTGCGAGPAGARRLQGAAEAASGPRWHGGGAGRSQERSPGADPQRRSRPAGPLQDWQPYKIINLRYAGDSGRSAESGSPLPQPDAARTPGPPKLAAAGPLSDGRGEEASRPAPRGEVAGENRAAFSPGALTAPSPPLKRACQRSEYSTQPSLNPTPPDGNSTQLSFHSKQSYVSSSRPSVNSTRPSISPAQPSVNSTQLYTNSSYVNSTRPSVNSTRPSISPAHPSVNSTQSSTNSSYVNSTRPSVNSTHPSISPAQPSVNSTHSSVNSTRPSISPAQPSVNSTHSSVNSTRPSNSPAEPSVNSTQSSINSSYVNSTQPCVNSAQSSISSTQLSVNSTHSSVNSTHPSISPAQLSVNSTHPSISPAQPSVNSTHSSVNSTRPSNSPAEPSVNSTQSSINSSYVSSTQPCVNSAQPSISSTQPSVNSTHPSISSTQSSVGLTQLTDSPTQPSISSTQPSNSSTHQSVYSTHASVNSTHPYVNPIEGSDNPTHQSVNSTQRSDRSTLSSPTIVKKMPPMKPLSQSHSPDRKLASPPSQPRPPLQATRFTSPPLQPKALFRPIGYIAPSPSAMRRCPDPIWEARPFPQALTNRHPSPPRVSKQQTPPASPTRSCPVVARKLPSPPAHRKLPSPPTQQKQPSSFLHRKLPTPPASSRQPTSASYASNSSPPISPGVLRKGSTDQLEDDWESQRSAKIGSNALSIFCPLSNSIFEAKPPSVNCFSTVDANGQSQSVILGDGSPMMSRATWRNSFMLRKPADRQRRLTLSGVHPQPFKKNYLLDCKIGTHGRLPTSAGSDPTLHSIGLDGNSENEGDPWMGYYVSDLRSPSRSVSHPELCVIGQRLQ